MKKIFCFATSDVIYLVIKKIFHIQFAEFFSAKKKNKQQAVCISDLIISFNDFDNMNFV